MVLRAKQTEMDAKGTKDTKISGLFLIILLFSVCGYAQKSMTFEQAKILGITNELDSLYPGGVDSDSTKSIFKDEEAYVGAYQQFISSYQTF
jgi:hypothetical protein